MARKLSLIRDDVFQIMTNKGPQTVTGHRYGALAVHEAYGGDGYVITHIPSGLNFNSAYGWFLDEEKAVAAMLKVAEVTEWENLKQEDTPKYGPICRDILHAAGGQHPGTRSPMPEGYRWQPINGYPGSAPTEAA
ncbi:hypothetical protein [Microvirga arsenatis]|uniref:Uncharacterized protein n=1 Tax=Microvirga arsenatis TaxID=2692265 RepID=A0ABW9YVC2_9HYPH|nr:hypothetical protein [Microvirga arsenatis]NBJ13311.1 hypothetical protein [Microvirga arsenatis]NBJ24095.1 hypothetical protein [Microvirga arsenatis]